MKAMILAGGRGTRLSEETAVRPKPMVEIGGRPILWHIMKLYSAHGINDFVVCLGYKGHVIKDYFSNYYLGNSDLTFDFRDNSRTIHQTRSEPWRVTLVDTGEETETGGRVRRAIPYVKDDEAFCLTYGDGLANVDIRETIDLHRSSGRLATLTATQPPGRFGNLRTDGNQVVSFREKPADEGWINGGFFVLSPAVEAYIAGEDTVWEREPLERLTQDDQLTAHKHYGFWQPMDTLRDKYLLESLWASGNAPWRVWA